MGRMKELFMEELQSTDRIPGTPIATTLPGGHVWVSYVKNYDTGTLIAIGGFHDKDTAWRKALQYINQRKIDAAQPEVHQMFWNEYESL